MIGVLPPHLTKLDLMAGLLAMVMFVVVIKNELNSFIAMRAGAVFRCWDARAHRLKIIES